MIHTDQLIPLRDVPKLPWLPSRRGYRNEDDTECGTRRLNLSTLWRWTMKGVKARDGAVVKLRALRVGDTLCTSEQWVREFFEALTAHDPGLAGNDSPLSSIRTPHQRQRASARAAKRLDDIGI